MLTMLLAAIMWAAPSALPCDAEDAYGCTWYASQQGNGEGYTFTVLPNGTLIYW